MDNSQPLVSVEGFADYSDVQVPDLVPWTPLKAGEALPEFEFQQFFLLLHQPNVLLKLGHFG